ncbi:MAG: hypothetical protein LBK06_04840 [Planctomycetaceae bacterium]|jgi:hypothetical protein|nr:hypothetical protein [Planctomycetaceae bacterium]
MPSQEMLFHIPKDLLNSLRRAKSEATVRQLVIQQLDCESGNLEEGRTDFIHENILIEFKLNEDMKHKEGDRAKILAQALYYCNAFYLDGKRVPPYIALIDKDEFVFYERKSLEIIYKQNDLFLNGNASDPNDTVIEKCKNVIPQSYLCANSKDELDKAIRHLRSIIRSKIILADDITEFNFRSVYSSWSDTFGMLLDTKAKLNRPFVCLKDCADEGQIVQIKSDLVGQETIEIHFDINGEIMMIQRCPREDYENFWLGWERIKDQKTIDAILKTTYDLFDLDSRRYKGQFYTPTELAKHGWAYLEKELGKNFWLDGSWRIWDCSCGVGGLAINVIPRSALQYTYLSSLDAGEIDHVKKYLPMCKLVWQMDFLNTYPDKFPDEVKKDIENSAIKWVFFINPPYGEGSSGKATDDTEWHKKGVSNSLVKEWMSRQNMSKEAKEKYAQFLFRIEKEFRGRYVLGCYTAMKAFVTKDYANLRKWWKPQFKGGLICCAAKWHQSAKNGMWPSVFSVFECREKGKWGPMNYDILEYQKNNLNGIFKGQKRIVQEDTKRSFRNYFFPNEGLDNNELTVVQANGLLTYGSKSITNNYRPKDTLASAFFISGYLRTRQYSRTVSGIFISHSVFINAGNYKRVLCGLGLYWGVKHTWINHEDCFLAPSRNLTEQEETDAILLSLVHARNRTTTARLPETIINTKKGRTINGGIIVENKLNPFDKKMFDWKHCSDAGKNVLQLYKDYLDNIVKWKEQNTVLGKGIWLGMYQYHRIIPLPKKLVAAIEKLRQSVEQTALKLCF